MPPTAGVCTLLCNVDLNITLLCTVHVTVEMLKKDASGFIPPTLWPLNSPDLNPVDYKIGR